MKYSPIKFIFISILFFVGHFQVFSQENDIHYDVTLGAGLSSNETLPFWLVSNRYGAVPNTDHLLLNASIYSNLKKADKDFGIMCSQFLYIHLNPKPGHILNPVQP